MIDVNSSYFQKNVLITGGAGFIGSNLASTLLGLGATVTIFDNFESDSGANRFNLEGIDNHIRLIQADIRDEVAMKDAVQGQDFLFNLAGQMSHVGSMQGGREPQQRPQHLHHRGAQGVATADMRTLVHEHAVEFGRRHRAQSAPDLDARREDAGHAGATPRCETPGRRTPQAHRYRRRRQGRFDPR